ncbi:unnamed protein product [Periconia digitata]|uniref:Uncharacterized protein n=1 Tax=Periconia digitata TaxID=1303443 RepID=A0A9W4XT41_9PLEO|nr:unnamed protein product [Periconia digitata]
MSDCSRSKKNSNFIVVTDMPVPTAPATFNSTYEVFRKSITIPRPRPLNPHPLLGLIPTNLPSSLLHSSLLVLSRLCKNSDAV